MALAPGVRLGPYEIAAQIGKGGMGEVYRARDTKLGRNVAITSRDLRLFPGLSATVVRLRLVVMSCCLLSQRQHVALR